MVTPRPTLVSFELCPYVQRAAIVLAEKGVPFQRIYVDLDNKPDSFRTLSPLGKVPLLKVDDGNVLFESVPIVEYLDESYSPRLHPEDHLERARHRAWIEVGSSILADIWVVETTKDAEAYRVKMASIRQKFERVEVELRDGPYFSGGSFRIVDAVFAPVFRYFDVFEELAPLELFKSLPRVTAWRAALHDRPSVRNAVVEDYADRLRAFVRKYDGVLANRGGTG